LKISKTTAIALAAAFLLGGCSWCLPAGDPPEGNIVDPVTADPGEPKTPEAAINYMTDEFLNASLGKIPANSRIYCNTALAGEVLRRCRGFAAYRPAALPEAEYLLLSAVTEGEDGANNWILALRRAADNVEIFRLKCRCKMPL